MRLGQDLQNEAVPLVKQEDLCRLILDKILWESLPQFLFTYWQIEAGMLMHKRNQTMPKWCSRLNRNLSARAWAAWKRRKFFARTAKVAPKDSGFNVLTAKRTQAISKWEREYLSSLFASSTYFTAILNTPAGNISLPDTHLSLFCRNAQAESIYENIFKYSVPFLAIVHLHR